MTRMGTSASPPATTLPGAPGPAGTTPTQHGNSGVGAFALAVIAATVAACTWALARTTGSYYFVFDDYALVGIAHQADLRAIVTAPLIGFFRPVVFLLLKAETAVFGWQHPGGYLAVTLLFHVLNSLLVWRLFTRLESSFHGAVAALLFVCSAWASEATMWLSGRFDVVATFGVLVAARGSLGFAAGRRSPARPWWLCAALLGAVLAVGSKESGAVAPVLAAVLLAWGTADPRAVVPRRAVAGLAALSLVVLAALAVRQAVLTGSAGAYGDFADLLRGATVLQNLRSYVDTAVHVPLPRRPPAGLPSSLFPDVHLVAGVACALATILALVVRPRQALLAIVWFGVAVAPVIWFGRQAGSTFAGRFSYLPGVGMAALLALGVEALRKGQLRGLGPATRPVAAVLLLFLGAYLGGSVVYQASLWRRASDIARSIMEQVTPVVTKPAPGVHLANMPVLCEEGPVIMKAYAFGFALGSVAPVRADGLVVSCESGQVRAVGPFQVQESAYAAPVPGEVELTLEFGHLAR